ncbi:MAG: tRNA (guanosine(37)-N1)-methyltransferase TrmD [bacterium]|nr:tRNA (guanosine(37)-N1)-methyltransferase TrmD [bacterium]
MKITILTLFPEMFTGPFDTSIIRRARDNDTVRIDFVNIRDFSVDRHKSVDDRPYGGGRGMILRVDVVDRALESVKKSAKSQIHTVLLDPQGTTFTQSHARRLAKKKDLVLLCGHYEGVDERVRSLVDEQISIGDYVLTGGEIPALVIADSVVRLLPGVLSQDARNDESFSDTRNYGLEYPHFTRPPIYQGMKVPDILLSGNHADIERWRDAESEKRTVMARTGRSLHLKKEPRKKPRR